MQKSLYRSATDRVVGGVAAGVAEYVEQDPALVRIVIGLLVLVTGGAAAILYLVLWLVLPEGPAEGSTELGPSYLEQWLGEGRRRTPEPPPAATSDAAPVSAQAAAVAPGTASVAEETPSEAPEPPSAPTPPQTASPAPAHAQAQTRSGGLGAARWLGLLLIGVGALMLAVRYAPDVDAAMLWPLIIVGAGLLMIFRKKGD